MAKPVIEVNGLGKLYRIGAARKREDNFRAAASAWLKNIIHPGRATETETFWALKDVSFDVQAGEVVGVIGRNGAGKSTLLKLLSRITEPTEGEARLRGRLASLLEVGIGFNPELTGRENVYLNGALVGLKKKEIDEQFDDIIEFSEIGKFIDTPVKRYSSGMYVRLAFAVAAHLRADILLVDEVLAVGDVSFQKKCMGRMDNIAKRDHRTVFFVSHNMAAIRNLCTRGLVFSDGKLVYDGEINNAVSHYLEMMEDAADVGHLGNSSTRDGTGALRFKKISFRNQAGEQPIYKTGEKFFIDLEYEAEKELRNVSLNLPVYTLDHQVAFTLDTRITNQNFEKLPPKGRITVELPALQLMGGRYLVNIWCEVNGVLADWVKEAALLDIESGDFFGHGHIPPPQTKGLVVVPHDFSAGSV